MGSGQVSEEQIECFVESVSVLAFVAGVKDELRAFDLPNTRRVVESVFAVDHEDRTSANECSS